MIGWYFILGTVFAFIMEYALDNNWNPKQNNSKRIHFNNLERIIMVIGWPIWLVQIIRRYINRNL